MMFCNKCGKALPEQSQFCPYCGTTQDAAVPKAEPVEAAPQYQTAGQASHVNACPAVEEKPKKKKSKKKLIIIIAAIVTVLALVAGLLVWFRMGGKQTIYVRTVSRVYNAAGQVVQLDTYEYNDRGMMLSFQRDLGQAEEVWNDEYWVYEPVAGPIDGTVDSYLTFQYNEQGDVTYVKDSYSFSTSSGYEYEYDYEWEYEDDLPVSAVMKNASDSTLKFNDTEYQFTYDEDENLTHIFYVNSKGEAHYIYKMAYDEEGRLTRYISCEKEGDLIYDFDYNEDGLVEEIAFSRGRNSANTDDVDVVGNSTVRTELKYTEDGQLKKFGGSVSYSYDDGKLVKKVEGESLYKFKYDGDTPKDVSGKRIYDENGCLIKVLSADGGYTEYEYQELELSEEDVRRHFAQQRSWLNPAAPDWASSSWLDALGYVIPLPNDPRQLVWPVTDYMK